MVAQHDLQYGRIPEFHVRFISRKAVAAVRAVASLTWPVGAILLRVLESDGNKILNSEYFDNI